MGLIDIGDRWKSRKKETSYFSMTAGMHYSKAYRSLSGRAWYVLHEFLLMRKYKGTPHIYDDIGPYAFPFAKAEGLGMTRATFTRSIRELKKKGFIKCVREGRRIREEKGVHALYRLVDDWKNYGAQN